MLVWETNTALFLYVTKARPPGHFYRKLGKLPSISWFVSLLHVLVTNDVVLLIPKDLPYIISTISFKRTELPLISNNEMTELFYDCIEIHQYI